MKRIYTSNYARNGGNPLSFGTSCTTPNWYEGKSLPMLAPTWSIVGASKDGTISEQQYAELYHDLLTSRGVTPNQLVDQLPDGAILLCYEKPFVFCHRRLLADWIERETGLEVLEILNDKEKQFVQQAKMVVDLLEF